MVSRQETARPLLTAGVIMQLPVDDELVLVSGCPPIKAKKVRYYQDKRLQQRILPPPTVRPARQAENPEPMKQEASWETEPKPTDDPANGGPRREPELPTHEEIAPKPPTPVQEFELPGDEREDDTASLPDYDRLARIAARQAALDRGDDMGM